MSFAEEILGLGPTGWHVNSTNKLLVKAAAVVAIGGGSIAVDFGINRHHVGLSGRGLGMGTGLGFQALPATRAAAEAAKKVGIDMSRMFFGREFLRTIVKYAGIFKFLSVKSDVYRYTPVNDLPFDLFGIEKYNLVLTTIGANVSLFGGALDYYAFYKNGEPNIPRWVWFAAGAEVSGGGSESIMQYKFEGLHTTTYE